MTTTSDPQTVPADRKIVQTRLFDAPRDLVFRAWTDPEHLGKWWGPTGFRTTTHRMDFKPGGTWRFDMHGPDGTDYPNVVTYLEVAPPERLVYKHGGEAGTEPVDFVTTVTFEDQGGKTLLTMTAVFPTKAARDYVVDNYGAIEGGRQTLARLAEFVEAKG